MVEVTRLPATKRGADPTLCVRCERPCYLSFDGVIEHACCRRWDVKLGERCPACSASETAGELEKKMRTARKKKEREAAQA